MPKSAKYPTNTKKSTSLSSTRMTSRQTGGKMSSAHGVTNGGGKHKTLFNASGSVGSDTRTMNKSYKEGPCNISKKGY